MTASSSIPDSPSHPDVPLGSMADLRKQARLELAASIRRGTALGSLSAGQSPWQILLTCFIQETGSETESEVIEFPAATRRLQFDDRWLFAVQDAGLIQIKVDDCFVITDLGVQVVEKCLGD